MMMSMLNRYLIKGEVGLERTHTYKNITREKSYTLKQIWNLIAVVETSDSKLSPRLSPIISHYIKLKFSLSYF